MLPVQRQLALAAVEAPTAVRRMGKKTGLWLAIYLGAAALVLGIVASIIVKNRNDLQGMVMDYLLPREWQFAARMLIERFFAQQEQLVLANAAIAAALLVVQITLFPVKEMVSAALEEEAELVDEPVAEHPLWFQAWEEVKLFLGMLAAQGTIFWIGYTQDEARRKLALVLSFVVLFASVAIDFLSPVLQRHKLRYSQILKSLLAHPVLTFGFGALFALPALGAAALASANPDWGFATQLAVAFGGQVLGIALAAIGGTVAGAPLVADARRRRRSHIAVRVLAWVTLVGLLGWNVYRFGVLGRSLHWKSQILKCDYAVDWDSFRPELPSALDLARAYQTDAITVGVSFDVTIGNATGVDLEIEDNRLEIAQAGKLVAQTKLPRVSVPTGTTQKVQVTVPLTVKPSQVLRIRELLTTKGWTITLWLDVADGFSFPIYLVTKT